MKTYSNVEIKKGHKYYAIEVNKSPARFMQILVVDLLEKENRVIVDFPYCKKSLFKLLPQELFKTKKEILKFLDCKIKYIESEENESSVLEIN